jgi:CheY-like chemotaxis protein
MTEKNILIVEDDKEIQEIYESMIQSVFKNVKIEKSFNGKEGLEAVQRNKPDLIILDLLMPVMDGEAFLKDLRHKQKIKDIPVVVCSVNQTLANKLLRLKEVEATLPKIFPLEMLQKIFKKFLGLDPS